MARKKEVGREFTGFDAVPEPSSPQAPPSVVQAMEPNPEAQAANHKGLDVGGALTALGILGSTLVAATGSKNRQTNVGTVLGGMMGGGGRAVVEERNLEEQRAHQMEMAQQGRNLYRGMTTSGALELLRMTSNPVEFETTKQGLMASNPELSGALAGITFGGMSKRRDRAFDLTNNKWILDQIDSGNMRPTEAVQAQLGLDSMAFDDAWYGFDYSLTSKDYDVIAESIKRGYGYKEGAAYMELANTLRKHGQNDAADELMNAFESQVARPNHPAYYRAAAVAEAQAMARQMYGEDLSDDAIRILSLVMTTSLMSRVQSPSPEDMVMTLKQIQTLLESDSGDGDGTLDAEGLTDLADKTMEEIGDDVSFEQFDARMSYKMGDDWSNLLKPSRYAIYEGAVNARSEAGGTAGNR